VPELPDVEILRRYLDSTALHQEIESVQADADSVLKGISSQGLGKKLSGDSFQGTRRHGKFLFISLEKDSDWLVLHFGMTGSLIYYKLAEKEPEYQLVSFNFTNGYHLAYVMTRKFGEVRIIPDVFGFIEERKMGPDVYSQGFTFEEFKKCLAKRHGMVKPTLMNQSIMAGIGNVYADEILFQAGIYPETKVNQLNQAELHEIYQQIKNVLQTAIDHQADPNSYPDSFLSPLRGDQDANCPRCDGKLEHIKVSGRSTYYCSNCQKKPG